MGQLPELTCLWVSSEEELDAGLLRELRRAPKLQMLFLGPMMSRLSEPILTAAVAEALVELPRLRGVVIIGHATEEGLKKLAGLPHLDTLLLEGCAFDEAKLQAVSSLRQLRTFGATLGGGERKVWVIQLKNLAKLPRLQALDLSAFEIDDEVLRGLPEQLEAFGFSAHAAITPDGLLALSKRKHLRRLTLRSGLRRDLQESFGQLLAGSGIESLSCLETPTAALWSAFQAAPSLRILSLRNLFALDQISEVCKLQRLESLSLRCRELPDAAAIAPLKTMASLRQLNLQLDPGTAKPGAQQLEALQQCLGSRIELQLRSR